MTKCVGDPRFKESNGIGIGIGKGIGFGKFGVGKYYILKILLKKQETPFKNVKGWRCYFCQSGNPLKNIRERWCLLEKWEDR